MFISRLPLSNVSTLTMLSCVNTVLTYDKGIHCCCVFCFYVLHFCSILCHLISVLQIGFTLCEPHAKYFRREEHDFCLETARPQP